MFESVLVANRGEIAVRVIRTLRRLGIRAIAVHSDADVGARHVREADTAVRLGPAPAPASYLSATRLLDAAASAGAEAVHPGYGFLAENAAFARAVTAAGLGFVGPPAAAIELMGDKIRAKRTVAAAGVPVVPGTSGPDLAAAARALGLPVLLKPSAGGGGTGMRLVRDADRLDEEIEAARRAARAAFGDDTLLAERWIDRPRHIEIQVLADAHGTVRHLAERECSLQRRHQKIIEEAPSPLLDPATRAAMGAAAVEAARACGYVGAGTVEFIVPAADPGGYCFMEMNTRLQVEHPVTELAVRCAGGGPLDLVEWQLRVASGEALPFAQADVTVRGHAVEARVCAETARVSAETARVSGDRVDFLPSAGTVRLLREPAGEGVRVDSGLAVGTTVGTAYDPLLAKVIAHGPDRRTALRRLRAALARTVVLGVDTNAAFLRALLDHPDVVAGQLDTGLVERAAAELVPREVPAEVYAAAALLRHAALEPPDSGGWIDPFAVPSGWRLGGEPAWTPHTLLVPGHEPVTVRVRGRASGAAAAVVEVRVGNAAPTVARLDTAGPPGDLLLTYAGTSHVLQSADGWIGWDGAAWHVQDHDPVTAAGAGGAPGVDTLAAPMPGTVTVVKAAVGDAVAAGQTLLVVEAMKMEHVIAAPHAGTVSQLDVTPGTAVAMDQVLAVVTPTGPVAESVAAPREDEP